MCTILIFRMSVSEYGGREQSRPLGRSRAFFTLLPIESCPVALLIGN